MLVTFFIFLIIAVVVDLWVKEKYQELWPKAPSSDLTGIIDLPIGYSLLCYIWLFFAELGVTIGQYLESLYDVNTYIGLFGGDWVGLVMQWLIPSDLLEEYKPTELNHFCEIASLTSDITTIIFLVSVVVCVIYLVLLKKKDITLNHIGYYTLAGCSILSTFVLLVGVFALADVTMEMSSDYDLMWLKGFIILITILCLTLCTWRYREATDELSTKAILSESTRNQFRSVIGLKKTSNDGPIKEEHIALSVAAIVLFIGFLIGFLLFYQSPEVQAQNNTEEYQQVEDTDAASSASTLEKQSTTDPMEDTITEYYNQVLFAEPYSSHLIKFSKRLYNYLVENEFDWDIMTNSQDPQGISAKEVVVHKCPDANNAYNVKIIDQFDRLYLEIILLMVEEDGILKVDNVIYTPNGFEYDPDINTNRPLIDYSESEKKVETNTNVETELEEIAIPD